VDADWQDHLSPEEVEAVKKHPFIEHLGNLETSSIIFIPHYDPARFNFYAQHGITKDYREWIEWLDFFIETYLTQWGIKVNGTAHVFKDDSHDSGVRVFNDSVQTWTTYDYLFNHLTRMEKIKASLSEEGQRHWAAAEALYEI
jgi:hypothetical protein